MSKCKNNTKHLYTVKNKESIVIKMKNTSNNYLLSGKKATDLTIRKTLIDGTYMTSIEFEIDGQFYCISIHSDNLPKINEHTELNKVDL